MHTSLPLLGRRAGNPQFSLAGTVYQKPTGGKIPIENAVVHVVDATGTAQDLTSNCAGNFYITVDAVATEPSRSSSRSRIAATAMSIKMTTKIRPRLVHAPSATPTPPAPTRRGTSGSPTTRP